MVFVAGGGADGGTADGMFGCCCRWKECVECEAALFFFLSFVDSMCNAHTQTNKRTLVIYIIYIYMDLYTHSMRE